MVFSTACVMQMGSLALAQAGAACQPGGTGAEVNACAVQEFQTTDTTIDVRAIAPRLRHPLIFITFESLATGESRGCTQPYPSRTQRRSHDGRT